MKNYEAIVGKAIVAFGAAFLVGLFLANVHNAPQIPQHASAVVSVPTLSKEDRDAITLSKLQWLAEHPKASFCRMFKEDLAQYTGIAEPCLTDQQLIDLGLR